jgi:hypothetical protein
MKAPSTIKGTAEATRDAKSTNRKSSRLQQSSELDAIFKAVARGSAPISLCFFSHQTIHSVFCRAFPAPPPVDEPKAGIH